MILSLDMHGRLSLTRRIQVGLGGLARAQVFPSSRPSNHPNPCQAQSMRTNAASDLSDYLRTVLSCNNATSSKANLVPFVIEEQQVGYLKPEFAETLSQFTDQLLVHREASSGNGKQSPITSVLLSPEFNAPDARSSALAGLLESLRDSGHIDGWRSELYPVVKSFNETPLCLIERAAVVHLGIKAYGVHVNGYVQTAEGIKMWVAVRSRSKPTWPGMLDHIVAGGQPYNLTCADNVVKECAEEAGIPEQLARQAKPVGAVSYEAWQPKGFKRDVLFCYDLLLPASFVPQPVDGEVEEFQLLPLADVAELVRRGGQYKDNCQLVIVDFLMRHGFFSPDQTGYLQLFNSLRMGDCT